MKQKNINKGINKRKLIILTSSIAPYRIKLFEILSQNFNFTVVLDGTRHEIHPWDSLPETKYQVEQINKRLHLKLMRDSILVVTNWSDYRVIMISVIRHLFNLPTILFFESTLKSSKYKSGPVVFVKKFIFGLFDSVVTVGAASTETVVSLKVPDQNIFEGFNCVDNLFFYQKTCELRSSNASQDYISDDHNLIFVGRLIDIKNVHLALIAWSRVRESRDRFFIVGEGPESFKLSELAVILGVDKHVIFTGYKANESLCEIFAKSHTLILPSRREVWGLVANEALAAGLHVVISNHCGASISLKNMKGVYICEPEIESIERSLLESKRDWNGPIINPEIHKYGPDQLAEVFEVAAIHALTNSTKKYKKS
jgi:glycosyltransferase involved in cell wall biosynthesis